MATTKTPLGLNQWELDEKLKMDDFNSDNRIIDETLRSHSTELDTLGQKLDNTDARLTDQMDALSDQLGGQMNDLDLRMDGMSEVVFYNAAATYTSGIFTLLGLPADLPAVYTVRFIAPEDYTYGDRIQVGSQIMSVQTLDGGAPQSGAFKAGVVLSMDIHGAGGRAYLGQGGGGKADYGVLPSQTQIVVMPGDACAEVTLSNVGGPAYAGTKLVCKQGGDIPLTQTDGQVYDAGQSSKYTMAGLTNDLPYIVRAFAYNRSGEVQTDVNGAVHEFVPRQGIPLGQLPTGTIIKLKENGVLVEFKVAQHNYIQSGVTAIERVFCLTQTVPYNSSGVNTYADGTLDTFLTTTYRDMLDQSIRNALVPVDIPVTSGNGSYTVTAIPRDVFIFSGTENGMENQHMVVAGSKVDIYTDNASRIKFSDDNPTVWRNRWLRSAREPDRANVFVMLHTGAGLIYAPASNVDYFAPVLTLPSTFLLSYDNEQLF